MTDLPADDHQHDMIVPMEGGDVGVRATPRPWRLGSWRDNIFGTGPNDSWAPVTRCKTNDLEATADNVDVANAALIVERVNGWEALVAERDAAVKEQARLRQFLSDGEYETVQSEQAWKARALAAETREAETKANWLAEAGRADTHRERAAELRDLLDSIVHFADGFVCYHHETPLGIALRDWINAARTALSATGEERK